MISDDCKELPLLPDKDFERVKNACYWFQFGKCTKSAKECMETFNKKHDKLPANLMQYCRQPGKAAAKARAKSATAVREAAAAVPPKKAGGRRRSRSPAGTPTEPKTRWDTPYCWGFADGTCKAKATECPRKLPHLTDAQAKSKAGGKARPPKAPSPAVVAVQKQDKPVLDITSALAACEALDTNPADVIPDMVYAPKE